MGQSFKDLVVWQRAIELGIATYHLTEAFPRAEQFGLTSQMRRAAVSVASNIAEGYGKNTRGEYLAFLVHARGSNGELPTQLVLARALGLGSERTVHSCEKLSEEVSRMLLAMMKRLKA